jgi:iron complex outermembrane receptor protein
VALAPLILGLSAPLALAQTSAATPAPASAATPAQPATATLPEVVVTGTRLKSKQYKGATPIQIITSDQAALDGIASTADLIRQTTATSGSFQADNQLAATGAGGSVIAGGFNVNTVSLRGLGPQRTLVLLDGQRMAPAGTGSEVGAVDLNVLPASIIDHVEVLTDGASTIYGSDAVAGVVNIITKQRYDGFEASFLTKNSEMGGANVNDLSALMGKTSDKGYITLALEWSKQDPLRMSQRPATACAQDLVFNPTTGAREDTLAPDGSIKCNNHNPNGVFFDTNYFGGTFVPTGALPAGNQPAILSSLQSYIPGFALTGVQGYPDSYSYRPDNSSAYENATAISPVSTFSLYLNGGYDFNAHLHAYGSALLNQRDSTSDSWMFLYQPLSGTNPNNTVAAGLIAASNGADNGDIDIQIVRPFHASQRVDYMEWSGGLKGDVPSGPLSGWDWDLNGRFGRSYGVYYSTFIYQDRLNAVTGPGVACNPSLINISGPVSACPSIPWLTPGILTDQNFTPAELSFLEGSERGVTTYDQSEIQGTATNTVLHLPAGDVDVAAGFSLRYEDLNDTPGYNAQENNYHNFSTAGVTKGSEDVEELFGEAGVPLLRDLPLINSLNLTTSGRYTNYSSYGAGETYKVGLDWGLTRWMHLRSSYGTSFRAPTLYELYLAHQTSFYTSYDPCTQYGSANSPTLQKNCAAIGLAPGFEPNGLDVTVTTGGGAGHLKAETSTNFTFGVVLSPKIVPIDIAIDYYDITVDNEITDLGYQNILSECYNNPVFPNNSYCGLVTRDPVTKNVTAVNDSLVNISSQINRGIDLSVNYTQPLKFGKLSLSAQGNWALQDRTQLLANNVEDYLGTLSQPEFVGRADATFTVGDWDLYYTAHMIGRTNDSKYYGGDTFYFYGAYNGLDSYGNNNDPAYLKEILYTPFYVTYDVSLRYRGGFGSIEFGVQNVTNQAPPLASVDASYGSSFRIGSTPTNRYDIVGRRYFLRLSKKFW